MRVYCLILILCAVLSSCTHRTYITDLPQKVIVIDPGHGGKDHGTGYAHIKEKDLTLSTAKLLKKYLVQKGYFVLLTRDKDEYIALNTRVACANTHNADLFISIHYNHSGNKKAEGIEVFYYPKDHRAHASHKLAQRICTRAARMTSSVGRGAKEGNFLVIRETKMPAILVEGGFLSHLKEREKIKSFSYKDALVQAIACEIEHYFHTS